MAEGREGFRRACEALARSPHDHELLYACCAAAGDEAEGEMIALLERRLAGLSAGSEIRLHDLHLLARLREKSARAAAGLHPTNTGAFEDLQFRFARDELTALAGEARAFLKVNRTSLTAAILLAEASAALGDFRQAEHVFAQLRRASGENTAFATNFDGAFHAALAEEALRSAVRLPPVAVTKELPAHACEIVYTAADYPFFQRFGWDLVESFAEHSGASAWLALHIFDLTDEEEADVIRRLERYPSLRWSLAKEWTGLHGDPGAKGYYHAIRYVRFWQLLDAKRASAWIIDTDIIFSGPVARLFGHLAGHDAALFLSPGRFEVRNKIMACATGAASTHAARDYFRSVAGYLGHYQNSGRLPWGIDQVALFAVAVMSRSAAGLRVAGVPDWICSPAAVPGQILVPAKAAGAAEVEARP